VLLGSDRNYNLTDGSIVVEVYDFGPRMMHPDKVF
jgi:hypothetical protein